MDALAADSQTPAERLHSFVRELFPLCRSITGDGLRQTLQLIRRRIPLELHEVPSGTPVLDWHVPAEWNVKAARIETLSGRGVVDFADCNLHVVGYSMPVDAVVSREELSHVHTLPVLIRALPYGLLCPVLRCIALERCTIPRR